MKRNLVYRIAVLTIIFSFVWTSRAFEKDSNEPSAISLSAPKLDNKVFEFYVNVLLKPDDKEYSEEFEHMNITVDLKQLKLDSNESHYIVDYPRVKRVDDEVLPKISDYQNYFTEFYDETSFKYNPNNDFLNKIVREWGDSNCRILIDQILLNRLDTNTNTNKYVFCFNKSESAEQFYEKFIDIFNKTVIASDSSAFSPPVLGQGFPTKMYSSATDQMTVDYIRIGKEGLSIYDSPEDPGTLKFGFRFDIIKQCKVDYNNSIVMKKANTTSLHSPPPSLCCINLTLAWSEDYITRNTFCSTRKKIYTCVSQIKILQRGMIMGCLDAKRVSETSALKPPRRRISKMIGKKVEALIKASIKSEKAGLPPPTIPGLTGDKLPSSKDIQSTLAKISETFPEIAKDVQEIKNIDNSLANIDNKTELNKTELNKTDPVLPQVIREEKPFNESLPQRNTSDVNVDIKGQNEVVLPKDEVINLPNQEQNHLVQNISTTVRNETIANKTPEHIQEQRDQPKEQRDNIVPKQQTEPQHEVSKIETIQQTETEKGKITPEVPVGNLTESNHVANTTNTSHTTVTRTVVTERKNINNVKVVGSYVDEVEEKALTPEQPVQPNNTLTSPPGNVIKSQYIRGDANDKHIQWLTQSPAKISTQERTLMETISKINNDVECEQGFRNIYTGKKPEKTPNS